MSWSGKKAEGSSIRLLAARGSFCGCIVTFRRYSIATGLAGVCESCGSHGIAKCWTQVADRRAVSTAQLRPLPIPRRARLSLGNEVPSEKYGNFNFAHWVRNRGILSRGAAHLASRLVGTEGMDADGIRSFPALHRCVLSGLFREFFDGKHLRDESGSPYAACMLRRSFRNWFQPNYPSCTRHFVASRTTTSSSQGRHADLHHFPRGHVSEFARCVRECLTKEGRRKFPRNICTTRWVQHFRDDLRAPEYGLTRADSRLLEK